MMKRKLSLCLLVLFCAFSVRALALPVIISQLEQKSSTFAPGYGTGQADVISTVYSIDAGYLYTYEIKNATVNLSWFSVGLIPGAAVSVTFEPGVDGLASWIVVGSPPASVDASFSMPIGATRNSSILWFTSPNDRTSDVGALGGYATKGYNFLQGDILTPIPEPATLALLGTGLLALRRKQ